MTCNAHDAKLLIAFLDMSLANGIWSKLWQCHGMPGGLHVQSHACGCCYDHHYMERLWRT